MGYNKGLISKLGILTRERDMIFFRFEESLKQAED